MPDITDHLNTIINGVLGEDVRQAIHDGISACYTDDRPGGVDKWARDQINQILAGGIGSTFKETVLYENEIFMGTFNGTNVHIDGSIQLTESPENFPFILLYYKINSSATPEIKMIKGEDFVAHPVVITAPFLESDGTRASIREMHIRHSVDPSATDTDYEVYYTYSWVLDSQGLTDGGHDVGRRRIIADVDDYEEKAIILTKIVGFDFVSNSAEQIASTLNSVMTFRDDLTTEATETIVDVTADSYVSTSGPYALPLGETIEENRTVKVTITADRRQHDTCPVYWVNSNGLQLNLIGYFLAGADTFVEYFTSPSADATKIGFSVPTLMSTYSVKIEVIGSRYIFDDMEDDITDLSNRVTMIEATGSGMNEDQKQALLSIFRSLLYAVPNGQELYDAFYTACYPDDPVGVPLYPLQNGTHTFTNNSRTLAITNGSHMVYTAPNATASGDPKGAYLDLSTISQNGQAGNTAANTERETVLFTIPANARVQFKILNISFQRLAEYEFAFALKNVDNNVLGTGSKFTDADIIIEHTFESATPITCVMGYARNPYSRLEADIRLYVNGVRWI